MKLRSAAFFLLVGGVFDILDGRIARKMGKSTLFGAYLDSLLDRYSDALIFLGILFYFMKMNQPFYAVLTLFALLGAFLISYSKARIQSLGAECRVGLMQRPVRIAIVFVTALFGILKWGVLALAILNHATVIERTIHAHKVLKEVK
jgi:CDP-diacylglycerol--glycerol-3-phosphate 3-phosphatidyltransferase